MLTCAFIVCLLQIAACLYRLRNYLRMPIKDFIGHGVGLVLAIAGALGTGPIVI